MWAKIKNGILSHPVLSIGISLIIIISIAGTIYLISQKENSLDGRTKKSISNNSVELCGESVKIGAVTVERDPAGDPEAWLRFDYTSTAKEDLNCQYTITFYDSQEEVIRMISNVEDTFSAAGGQIHNGYSSTPYQEGMTAQVTLP